MTTPRAKGTVVPEDFHLNETTLKWKDRRYPDLDVELCEERFISWTRKGGYMYVDHQRAFQDWINGESDKGRLGVLLKKAKPALVLQNQADLRARQMNFRARNQGESDASYMWSMDQVARSNVTKLKSAMK